MDEFGVDILKSCDYAIDDDKIRGDHVSGAGPSSVAWNARAAELEK